MNLSRRTRKSEDGFNLAFLDVMACGLGAIILIFMLVDFNSVMPDPSEELARIAQDQQGQQTQIATLTERDNTLDSDIVTAQAAQQIAQRALALATQAQQTRQAELAAQQAQLAELEQALAALGPIPESDANLALAGTEAPSFLLGLAVEGQHIVIMVDVSASMMAGKLIDIFRLKAQPLAQQLQAPKWQQNIRTAQWLLARAPSTSKVSVLAYAEQSQWLARQINPTDTAAMSGLQQALLQLIPQGGTNLEQALLTLQQDAKGITDIYVITDGLPTKGNTQGLNQWRQCGSFFGSSNTISGECRETLFAQAIKQAPRVTTNVILLPLEGDPKAAYNYWLWSQVNGGTALAPTQDWP
jgi:hypothetical protein